MKKIYLPLVLLLVISAATSNSSFGQGTSCPSLSVTSPSTSCSVPCATIVATPSVVLSATTSYTIDSVPYTPFSYTTGTVATYSGLAWSATTDDYYGDLVPLPFNFCFFGVSYSAIVIGTNGNINFNTTGATSLVNAYDPYSISGPMPGSNCTATMNSIMGVWNDTYFGGGTIRYATYGTAPCRKFVISWGAVDLFLPGTYCDGNTTTSQIVLFETTNTIEIFIGNRVPCTDWNSGFAVCGIENATGTTFYCPPGENGTTFTAVNKGWMFSPAGAVTPWHYTWTGPGVTSSDTNAITVCPLATSTYTVTATSCSASPITAVSTVTSAGYITPITGSSSICQGFSTSLSNATSGGVWSSSNPGIASVSPTGMVTAVSGGTATISYTIAGCSATLDFTVNPTPSAPIPNVDVYCQYATAAPVSAVGTNLTWYGPGVTTGTTVAPTPTTTTAGTITYYVTQTSAFGCISDSATDVVTIKPKPSRPVTHDTSYCQYFASAPSLLSNVDSFSGTLNWYVGATLLAAAPVPSTLYANYPSGSTWNVSQTVNGCESDLSPIKVVTIPTPEFTLNYKGWICANVDDTLTFTMNPGSSLLGPVYTWGIPGAANYNNGTGSASTIIDISFTPPYPVTNIGTLTISNFGGRCFSTDTFRIKVVELPAATAYMVPEVCKGDTVLLALTSRTDDAAYFHWDINGTDLFSTSALTIVATNASTGGTYRVVWNDTGLQVITLNTTTVEGCLSNPFFDTIRVHQLPDASFSVTPLTGGKLCVEDSMIFRANAANETFSYLWQPNHYFSNNNRYYIYGKVENLKSMVSLTVTDPFGCKSVGTEEIDPLSCCTVSMPTAFTPNNDGKNDHFRPLFDGFHRFHQFRIMNRWGETVFESANTLPEWDGSMNGVPQDMGVYFYYIKYDCGGDTKEQKGECTLVK